MRLLNLSMLKERMMMNEDVIIKQSKLSTAMMILSQPHAV